MVNRRGFSLVEVVVALVILEIALLGVVASGLYALRLQRAAEAREQAVSSAAAVLDSLLAVDTVSAARTVLSGVDLQWSMQGTQLILTAAYQGAKGRDSLRFELPSWSARAHE